MTGVDAAVATQPATTTSPVVPPSGTALGLEAAGLSKRFGGAGDEVIALTDVHVAAPKGSFVSVIGPSGCGKSTLLRIFADLVDPTDGTARVNGKTPEEARSAREVGVVFQSPNLLPWRSVLKNVMLPLQVMGVERAEREPRAMAMLELVGLHGFEKRLPAQLSGGMQQRVAIARALSMNPSVLLMDEPFGALDEITRDRMNLELMAIWRKGGGAGGSAAASTVLFITHSISEAVFLSSQVVVMSARPGRIVATVDIDLPHPRTAETREEPRFFELVTEVRHHLVAASAPASVPA